MDDPTVTPVDDMEPCVPLMEASTPPPAWQAPHPSGMNRAQRREAYQRHKAADRDRRMRLQAAQQRRSR